MTGLGMDVTFRWKKCYRNSIAYRTEVQSCLTLHVPLLPPSQQLLREVGRCLQRLTAGPWNAITLR